MHAANEADFRKIYDANIQLLLKVACHIVNDLEAAEDLVHDSLIKMHEKQLVFPSPDDAKYWLLRVVKNASLNYAGRKTRERLAYKKVLDADEKQSDSGETIFLKTEEQQYIKESLEKLPPNLKIVLVLREYADLNYKEIGRVLNITEGNVKIRIFRAREKLAKLIGENNDYVSR